MKQQSLCVKIQSWTDIITNSSTEIFCIANNTGLLRNFLNDVLHLIDPNSNIDDLVTIQILPSMREIQFFINCNDNLLLEFLKERGIDKDYFSNALDLSSFINLAPIDSYLKQFNYTYIELCSDLDTLLYEKDSYPMENDYVLVPVNDNVNIDLIYKLNNMLHNFAENLYNIIERYN